MSAVNSDPRAMAIVHEIEQRERDGHRAPEFEEPTRRAVGYVTTFA